MLVKSVQMGDRLGELAVLILHRAKKERSARYMIGQGAPHQLFESMLFLGIIFETIRLLEHLGSGFFLLLVIGKHALVMAERFLALARSMMHPSQKVARVCAKYRIGKGGQETQGSTSGEMILEEKTSEAVIIQPQSAITALAELRILKERFGDRSCFLGFVAPEKHLRLIAARAGGPFQLNGCFFFRMLRLGYARGKSHNRGGEVLARFLETLVRRVAMLIRFLRFGQRLRMRLCAQAALR